MTTNDTAKLYQFFGGQASDYQELRRSDEAKSGKERWPLLAWLDLSALHVPDAPKVQVGEVVSQPAAKAAPQAKPMPALMPVAPVSPVVPVTPVAPVPPVPPVAAVAPAPVVQVAPAARVTAPTAASSTALQQMFARLAQVQTSTPLPTPPLAAAVAPASAHAQPALQATAPEPTPSAPARSPLWTQLSKL